MSHARVTTRPGAYADSVRLIQVSQLIRSADGVEAALVAMATDLNLDLAREMGFTVSDATADDLLIAVRATDATALDAAVELAEQRLAARPHPREPGGTDGVPARTVRSVARQCTSRWSARAIPTWRPQLRTSFTPSASIRSVGPSGPAGAGAGTGAGVGAGSPFATCPPAASRRALWSRRELAPVVGSALAPRPELTVVVSLVGPFVMLVGEQEHLHAIGRTQRVMRSA